MNIAGMRVRITIQKNATVVDRVGNHTSAWTDYFSCWATAVTSGLSSNEEEAAGHTVEADRLDITVRYSSETAAVNSKEYRIMLGDRIYNILSIDEMGFKHNSRKLQVRGAYCRRSQKRNTGSGQAGKNPDFTNGSEKDWPVCKELGGQEGQRDFQFSGGHGAFPESLYADASSGKRPCQA